MSVAWAYVSEKLKSDDDVQEAIARCKTKAIAKLGTPDIELYEFDWTPDYVCTRWRLVTPDQPPPP